MDGNHLKRIRAFRNQTEQEFLNDVNERFRRRYDKPKVAKWESGKDTIPDEVAGLMLLWNLGYARNGGCKTVTICLRKGGTSKSTTTTGLGHVLASAGARTLNNSGKTAHEPVTLGSPRFARRTGTLRSATLNMPP